MRSTRSKIEIFVVDKSLSLHWAKTRQLRQYEGGKRFKPGAGPLGERQALQIKRNVLIPRA
jgi:hypothetical protein